ncbi:ankyrin repeat domain-containing protein [Brachyspira hyodysenteriae]|nr:ankyrin repeat domain-containing protein [Brachyspira hyodysenteriae]MCZ9923664.1 ankyrin repeat domain-containing protein [Brachyspira hyodysenteriae]
MKRNIELVKASRLGDLEKVKNILETTEEFEHNELNIALEYALLKGHRDIVKELVIAGASNTETKLRLNYNNVSFYYIVNVNYVECIYELMLIYYSYIGDFEMAELLIDSGVNDLNRALMSASEKGHLEIVKLLIDSGANDLNGALMSASENGHLEVVKYLLDSGADVNAKYNDTWHSKTALMFASEKGHLEVVKYLIDKGADDLNIALTSAAKNGHSEVAEFLKSKGAK